MDSGPFSGGQGSKERHEGKGMVMTLQDVASIVTIVFLGSTIIYTVAGFARAIWPRIRALFAHRAKLPMVAIILILLAFVSVVGVLTIHVVSTVREVITLNNRVNKLSKTVSVQGVEFKNLNDRFSKLKYSESKDFSWYQGQAEVKMIKKGGGICFLTYVSGKFEGGEEAVSIFEKQGYWYLEGRSHQEGVSARAVCWEFPSALEMGGDGTTDD